MIRISICFLLDLVMRIIHHTALAFYNIPRSNSFNNDYYPDDLYMIMQEIMQVKILQIK
jgi:hypothetical protein